MGRTDLQNELADMLDTVENEIVALDLEPDHSELLAKVYELPDEKIKEIANAYLPLKITNALDKNGRVIVHDALMDVKNLVSKIEKVRLKTNEKAQAWIKINNGEAKRLTRLLEPVKDHLQTERDRHDNEVEAIKAEKQKLIDLRNQGRVDALLNVGTIINLAEVVLMSDETFGTYLQMATKAFNERNEQEAKDLAELKVKQETENAEKLRLEKLEAERITQVKAEQDAEAKRLNEVAVAQKKQATELQSQMDEINKAKAEIEKSARENQIRIEAEARLKAQAEQDGKNRVEIEAARPDADKLIAFANKIDALELPILTTTRGQFAMEKISRDVDALCKTIENLATEITK